MVQTSSWVIDQISLTLIDFIGDGGDGGHKLIDLSRTNFSSVGLVGLPVSGVRPVATISVANCSQGRRRQLKGQRPGCDSSMSKIRIQSSQSNARTNRVHLPPTLNLANSRTDSLCVYSVQVLGKPSI